MITRSASDRVFQHVGLCADIAADGESAMEMLRRRDYDLLLLVRPPCPRARASSNCLPMTLTLTLTPTLTLTLRRPGCAPSGRERLRALLVVQEHHAQRGAPDWVRTSDLTLTLAFILTFSVALALTLIAGTWSPSRPTRTCRRAVSSKSISAYPSRSRRPPSSRPSKTSGRDLKAAPRPRARWLARQLQIAKRLAEAAAAVAGARLLARKVTPCQKIAG